MDILASRLAKDANFKSKSAKKEKKLTKDADNKSKTRSVPKVDSSKVGKISKKQKVKNVVTEIPPKKKQAIKNIIQSQNNENETLIQKVTNVKNKKSKTEDVKQKVKDIKKSLKDVISKPVKAEKKDSEVLKNKINLLSDVKSNFKVITSKKEPETIKNKKGKNVQPELVKSNKVKRTEPEVTKSKKIKAEPEVEKNKKVQRVGIETVQSKKNKKIKSEAVKNSETESKISKSNLESDQKPKLNKKEIKSKESILNSVKPGKTKNLLNEESTDDSDQKKKLKLSKTLKSKNINLVKVENNQEIKSIKSKKRKHEDVEQEDSEISTQSTLTKKEVLPFVKALLKVAANDSKSKNSLFNSEKPPILLTIASVKVPKVPLHQMRIPLPHCMVTDDDEVALFVKDLKKGRRRDYEDTVHHYEDLLQQNGCTRVKTIIPINQVKTEYRQFEMRRRLLNSYDYFLTDGRIAGHLAHLLGKTFRLQRKLPTSIHLDKKNLKEEIDNALKKTSLEIHSTGDSSITQVATCSMSAEKITENILAVAKYLGEHFPGGWSNIRSLNIKTPLSLAIPIYITLKSRNTVKVPVVNPKRPKAYKDVEGELSTFIKNVSVKVAADGTVDVQHLGGNESDIEYDEDDEDAEDENEEGKEKTKDKVKIEKTEESKGDEDNDDDDDAEEDGEEEEEEEEEEAENDDDDEEEEDDDESDDE